MFKFQLPIGDWSRDGHGKCEWYTISSNMPLEYVRELYFKTIKELGFSLDGSNADYGPCSVPNDPFCANNQLKNLNITVEDLEWTEIDHTEIDHMVVNAYMLDPDKMANLFITFMNKHNPKLTLKIVNTDMFHFYGKDDQGRHIGYIGYGLFE